MYMYMCVYIQLCSGGCVSCTMILECINRRSLCLCIIQYIVNVILGEGLPNSVIRMFHLFC